MRYAKECLSCPEAEWTCPLKGKGKGSYYCQGVCMSSAHPNDPCTDRGCKQQGCPWYGNSQEVAHEVVALEEAVGGNNEGTAA